MKNDSMSNDRKTLKTVRDNLFRRYELFPSELHLALKIKRIDDQIADDIEREDKKKAKR
jgi:hypothetical protein